MQWTAAKKTLLALSCAADLVEAPSEIQIVPFGAHQAGAERFILDEAAAADIVAAFDSRQNDVVIDYEHQTLSGQEAPAAGWIKKLINKGQQGVWAVVEWTEKAKAYLKAKEYRYLSPVILVSAADRRVHKLLNAALTNAPAIDGMVPLVNSLKFPDHFQVNGKGVPNMKTLLAALGLPELATEEQAIAALEEVRSANGAAKVIAAKSVLEALGLKPEATESEITGTILALKQGHDQTGGLATEVKALKDKLAARDAAELVELAMKEGKITPAQKDWASAYAQRDPEGFKIFVSKAPVVVQTQTIAGSEPAHQGALDQAQMEINKKLGISEDAFKKYNAA